MKEQCKQNIHRHAKKEEKKPKRKQTIVQNGDLLVQKLITSVTLGEYFPPDFFNRRMITSTHMVFSHETLVEDRPSEDEENALLMHFGSRVSSVSPPFPFLQASYLHEHFKTHLKNILKLN